MATEDKNKRFVNIEIDDEVNKGNKVTNPHLLFSIYEVRREVARLNY